MKTVGWALGAVTAASGMKIGFQDAMLGQIPAVPPPPKKVPVTLAVMSRCPDAQVPPFAFAMT